MATWAKILFSVVGAAAFSLLSRPALANEPATANVFQWGIGFRYGFELEDGDFNPWGTGLGVEVGYTLPNAIYLGGNFDYFFGEKVETALGSVESNLWQLMGEGGYDIAVGPIFVIRPKVGAGFASTRLERCGPELCEADSQIDFAIAPGAKFLLLTENFGLSVDLRYDMIFAADEPASALILSVGIGF